MRKTVLGPHLRWFPKMNRARRRDAWRPGSTFPTSDRHVRRLDETASVVRSRRAIARDRPRPGRSFWVPLSCLREGPKLEPCSEPPRFATWRPGSTFPTSDRHVRRLDETASVVRSRRAIARDRPRLGRSFWVPLSSSPAQNLNPRATLNAKRRFWRYAVLERIAK